MKVQMVSERVRWLVRCHWVEERVSSGTGAGGGLKR